VVLEVGGATVNLLAVAEMHFPFRLLLADVGWQVW